MCVHTPHEPLNNELCRRADVVEIFPNRDALVRLVATIVGSGVAGAIGLAIVP